MNHYLAVTTCNKQQWKQYGRAMINTFCRNWPAEVDIWLYAEGFAPTAPIEINRPPVIVCDLERSAPWLVEFKAKYSEPKYTGGSARRDYRRDAVRFSHKVAALGAAAEEAECDVLLWVDADIVTFAPVTIQWLDSLFPPPANLAWLDRDKGVYPECGFMMFRMPESRELIERVVEMYRTGAVLHLHETHDSYVFQHVVNAMDADSGRVRTHSLSGAGRVHTGHPFVNSPLAACMDHLKGEIRKGRGMSLPSDLKIPRNEEYWRKVKNG